MSEKLLAWRKKQRPGAIMKPSTFEAIVRKAAASGADDPKAVAGAAYWQTAKTRFSKRALEKARAKS